MEKLLNYKKSQIKDGSRQYMELSKFDKWIYGFTMKKPDSIYNMPFHGMIRCDWILPTILCMFLVVGMELFGLWLINHYGNFSFLLVLLALMLDIFFALLAHSTYRKTILIEYQKIDALEARRNYLDRRKLALKIFKWICFGFIFGIGLAKIYMLNLVAVNASITFKMAVYLMYGIIIPLLHINFTGECLSMLILTASIKRKTNAFEKSGQHCVNNETTYEFFTDIQIQEFFIPEDGIGLKEIQANEEIYQYQITSAGTIYDETISKITQKLDTCAKATALARMLFYIQMQQVGLKADELAITNKIFFNHKGEISNEKQNQIV